MTKQEIGASELAFMLRDSDNSSGIGTSVPILDPERNIALYRALTNAMENNMIRSAHDCSDGGLSVSLAESCFGFRGGADIDVSEILLSDDELDEWGALFGESLGRIIVTVSPERAMEFEKKMEGHATYKLGKTTSKGEIKISAHGKTILKCEVDSLKSAWKGTLDRRA